MVRPLIFKDLRVLENKPTYRGRIVCHNADRHQFASQRNAKVIFITFDSVALFIFSNPSSTISLRGYRGGKTCWIFGFPAYWILLDPSS